MQTLVSAASRFDLFRACAAIGAFVVCAMFLGCGSEGATGTSEIRQLVERIKLHHPEAKHIRCALLGQ